MLRRSISFLLALAMIAGTLPLSVWAEGGLETTPASQTQPEETTAVPTEAPEETMAAPTQAATQPAAAPEATNPDVAETEDSTQELEDTDPTEEAASDPTEALEETEPTEEEATESTEQEETEPTKEEETKAAEKEEAAPTEEVETEPAESSEDTEPPGDEVTDPTEEDETEPTEETAPAEEPLPEYCSENYWMAEDESDALFEGFLSSLFFGDSGISTFGILAREHLGDGEKFLYDSLKDGFLDIAMGSRNPTIIQVIFPAGGYSLAEIDYNTVTRALVHDNPFESYWYHSWKASGVYDGSGNIIYSFKMQPQPNYRPSDFDEDNPTIITAKAAAAVTASNNAKAIVQQYAGYSDYNKLCAYADKICALVTYDYNAANNKTYEWDINPWTLVNVFDNDTSTNVVCEGYAEAFQYLCDCSTFQQDVECYSPSGNNHKWNIVRINSVSYLMDVTHCDNGSTAYRGPKFLGGGSGSVESGYVIGGFNYAYYDEVKTMFGTGDDSILKLSPTKFDPNASLTTMTQADFEQALAVCSGSYRLTKSVILDSNLTLDGVRLTIASGGGLQVSSGTVLKIKANSAVTVLTGGTLSLDTGAALLTRGTVSGTIQGSGVVCSTDSQYLAYLAEHAASLTIQSLRSEVDEMNAQQLLKALRAENLSDTGLLAAVTTLEKLAGSPVTAAIDPALTDLQGNSFSLLGGNLSTPAADTPMVLEVTASQSTLAGSVSGFRLTLSGAEAPINLAFPVCITVNLPSNWDSSAVTLRQAVGSGSQIVPIVSTSRSSFRFATDTLGDFFLCYPTSGTCGQGLQWSFDRDTGSLTLSGTGSLPDYYGSQNTPWAVYKDHITSVSIGQGITALGSCTFQSYGNLTRLSLPEGLTAIGERAFQNCAALTGVSLPGSLTTIGAYAFDGCAGLTELILPRQLSSLGNLAFGGCTGLKLVFFTGSVPSQLADSDGMFAGGFWGTEATVYYPNDGSWTESPWVETDTGIRWKPYGDGGGMCGENLYWLLDQDTGLLTVTGSGDIGSREEGGLWHPLADRILSISLDAQITGIGDNAFAGLTKLTRIAIPDNVSVIGAGAFQNCTALETATLPQRQLTLGEGAFQNSGLTEIRLEAVTAISARAFAHCGGLKNLYFGSSVPAIAQDAFAGVKALASYPASSQWTDAKRLNYGGTLYWEVMDPTALATGRFTDDLFWSVSESGALKIFGSGSVPADACALWAETGISSVTLEAGVTGIGSGAFAGLSGLRSVTAANLSSLGEGVFAGCTALETVSLSGSLTVIPAGSFAQCPSIQTVVLPGTLEQAAGEEFGTNPETAFLFDGSILKFLSLFGPGHKITAQEGVFPTSGSMKNGSWALSTGGSLYLCGEGSMEDYAQASDAPWYAFKSNIKAVTVGQGITRVGNLAFSGCTAVKTLQLADSVTQIGAQAFQGCTALSQVTLPEKLERIEGRAFQSCPKLGQLRFPGSLTAIGEDAFALSTVERVVIADLDRWCAIDFQNAGANPLGVITYGFRLEGSDSLITQLTVPSRVSAYAFAGCKKLTKITLPADAQIGCNAFTGCTNATISFPGTFSQLDATGYSDLIPVTLSDGSRILGCGVTDPQDPREPEASFCGIRWVLHQSGELRFYGSGRIELNDKGELPWSSLASRVSSVVVAPGVTALCGHVFDNLGNVKTIILGPDVQEIEDNAFTKAGLNATVLFQGCPGQIGQENFGGQTLWAYYRPADGWEDGLLGNYKAKTILWLPYENESTVLGTTGSSFTLTAQVPESGLVEPDSTTMQVYALDKTVAVNPRMLTFSIPESQKNIAAVDENGVITAGSSSGTVTVTAALKNDPQGRRVSLNIKCQTAPLASLELIPQETNGISLVPGDSQVSDGFNVFVERHLITGQSLCFVIQPKLVNTLGNTVPAGNGLLKWSVSDSRVASVAANADGSVTVTVKAGATGSCKLTAATTDSSKLESQLTISIRDYAPKLAVTAFTLNSYRLQGASTLFTERYGNTVDGSQIALHEYSAPTRSYQQSASPRFEAVYSQEDRQLTIQAAQSIPNGSYKLLLRAGCQNGTTYEYPISVTVRNSLPTVRVSQESKFNLFYTDSTADFTVTAAGAAVERVELDNATTDTFRGSFDEANGMFTLHYSQAKLDHPSARVDIWAALTVRLEGYREPVRKNITISTVTVKPKLSLQPASSVFNLNIGSHFSREIQVYDSTAQAYVADYQINPASFVTASGPDDTGKATLTLNSPYTGGTVSIRVQPDNWMQPITLSHRITVTRSAPTASLNKSALVVDRLFPDRADSAAIQLSQCNLGIRSVSISAAAGEAEKLQVVYDGEQQCLRASIADPANPPRTGTYSFRYVVTLDDAKGTTLPVRTFRVQVKASLPSFRLSTSTLRLNRLLGDAAWAETAVTLTGNPELVLDDLLLPEDLDSQDIQLSYSSETGLLTAQLESNEAVNQRRTLSLIPVVRRLDNGQQLTLTEKPIRLTLQIYQGTPRVSLSRKGTLDTLIPTSAITYTANLYNLTGRLEAVRLEGEDAGLFRASVDETGKKVMLSIAENAQCALGTTYRLSVVVTIRGREYPVAVSFQVRQSSLRCTAPSSLFLYQAAPVTGTIRLQSPNGAAIESIRISSRTNSALMKAIGDSFTLEPTEDESAMAFSLGLSDPSGLTRGRSYALYLDVIAKGSASNASATTVKITIKYQ